MLWLHLIFLMLLFLPMNGSIIGSRQRVCTVMIVTWYRRLHGCL
jgi:hypothetical protein